MDINMINVLALIKNKIVEVELSFPSIHSLPLIQFRVFYTQISFRTTDST